MNMSLTVKKSTLISVHLHRTKKGKHTSATVSLYYDNGNGERYRSLGCAPCTLPIKSNAKNPREIVEELRSGALKGVAERSGRSQDAEDGGGLETLRKGGYM